ncbi:GDP-L-fucose synthase [Paludibacter sp. 221]|uniref:GDP-L-fucose synthase family protein n=1 Tax=Paludibacter sp. 221 TaxID=2302939 RepID=UPI0013D89639|nr:GDP-L-fucose synthase [Paludibacter sp. 221]NDV46201.1 GDP-L-fucose synthase [Paludibacter sp. 221]
MDKKSKIYIAGHKGMVGSAIKRNLEQKGFVNIVTRTHSELDLLKEQDVVRFFENEKPEYVVLAAAKVGGIVANNTYRAQFIYENLMIQNHIIHQSYLNGVKKLLFLGSSCIYPRMARQPIAEDELLTGFLEPTNEPYAIAKIAGIKMCEAYHAQYGCNFISIMPTNLYGPNDNYDLEKSHVLPALIRKMYLGKCLMEGAWDKIVVDLNERPVEGISGRSTRNEIIVILSKYGIFSNAIELWGTGSPMREFLHVDDMADASVFLLQNYDAPNTIPSQVNAGCGEDTSIYDLAYLVKRIVDYQGEIKWDKTKPDGTPRKLLNVSTLKSLGWMPSISLEKGINHVVDLYRGLVL